MILIYVSALKLLIIKVAFKKQNKFNEKKRFTVIYKCVSKNMYSNVWIVNDPAGHFPFKKKSFAETTKVNNDCSS